MESRSFKEFFIDSLKYIIVIGIFLGIMIFSFSLKKISDSSMESVLYDGDLVIVNKLVYRFRDPKRGEIISFNKNNKVIVSRIIGLPGETIEYKDNKLYINGDAFNDNFAANDTFDMHISELGVEKIPEGQYFVIGDNRSNIQNSNDYGLVKLSQINGRVIIRLYPFNKIKTM